jgi:hypothetical protein
MSEQAWRLSHQSKPKKFIVVSSELERLWFHSTTWELLKTPEISQWLQYVDAIVNSIQW